MLSLKVVTVLFLATNCYGFPKIHFPSGATAIENIITNSLECFRGILQNGIPDLGLHPLDPLHIAELPIDFDKLNISSTIRGQIDATDVSLSGLSHWKISGFKGELKILPPSFTLSLNIHYDSIVLKSNYKGDITLRNKLNVHGEGTLSVELQGLNTEGHARISLGRGFEIKDLTAPTTLDKAIVKITGLDGNEELSNKVSEELSALVPQIISKLPEHSVGPIAPAVVNVIKDIISSNVAVFTRIGEQCVKDIIHPPH